MVDYNEAFDEINEHRKYSRAGFTKGYAMGEEAGWREGFLFGLKKGASLATEIGFYQGYTTAWLTLLEKQDQGKARKVQALRSLLEMARSFPLEEQLLSSLAANPRPTTAATADPMSSGGTFAPRLSKIRAKFRQVQGLLLDQPNLSAQRGTHSPQPPPPPQPASTTTHLPHHPHVVPGTTAAARGAGHSTSTSSTHHLHPPPPQRHPHPHHSSHPTQNAAATNFYNWINRSRSPLFAGSFESRTSSQTDGGGGGGRDAASTAPTEMSF